MSERLLDRPDDRRVSPKIRKDLSERAPRILAIENGDNGIVSVANHSMRRLRVARGEVSVRQHEPAAMGHEGRAPSPSPGPSGRVIRPFEYVTPGYGSSARRVGPSRSAKSTSEAR